MGGKHWKDNEIEIMKKYYCNTDMDKLLELLPDRNYHTIKKKAQNLNLIKEFYWSEKELEILKENYQLSFEEINKLLSNRTIDGIKLKLNQLNYYKINKWNDNEINLLINNYETLSQEELLKLLPNRNWNSIVNKSVSLNLSRRNSWSEKEIIILKNCKYIDEAQEKLLDKTYQQIYHKSRDLKLFLYKKPIWDELKNNDLIINYHNFTKEELIQRYNCSWNLIHTKAKESNLGVRLHDDCLIIKRKELETGKRICSNCRLEKDLNFNNYSPDNSPETRLGFKYICRECEEKRYPRKTNKRHGEKIDFTIEEILEKYCIDGWSLMDFAKYYHRGYKIFKNILLENNVVLRTEGEQASWNNRYIFEDNIKNIYNDYTNKLYNFEDLQFKYNINKETLRLLFIQYNIIIRDPGEACSIEAFNRLENNKDKVIKDYLEYGIDNCARINKTSEKLIYKLLEQEGIERKSHSVYQSGKYYSKKMNKDFYYRSSYELDYFIILDNNDFILSYTYEELKIPYFYNGEWHNYIPDFVIRFKNDTKEIHEVKPKRMIEYDDNVKIKAKYAKIYCKDNDMIYKFITEDDLYN